MNILFIANGRSKRLKKIKKNLAGSNGSKYHIITTTSSYEAVQIASESCKNYSHIVGIGGDGTLHEIVNGVMQKAEEGESPIISMIPSGTANDFAKSFAFPMSMRALFKAIEKNNVSKCDVGEITFHTEAGEKQKRYFVNIADAGIGAMVVDEVNHQPSTWGPNITFFRAIITSFRSYINIPIKCVADEWDWEGRIKMLAVANGRYFGSGLAIAPHAEINDGKFAVTIGADISTLDYIKYLPALKRGEYINHPQLFYKEARSIKLTSTAKCAVEADGEWLGYTPVEIKVLPKCLTLLKGN